MDADMTPFAMELDDADPPEDRPSLLARIARGFGIIISWLIALPLWLGVLTFGLGLAGAWIVPLQLEPTSRLGTILLTGAVFIRVFQFHVGVGAALAAVVALMLTRRRLLIVSLLVAMPVLLAEAWLAIPDTERPTGNGPDPTLRVAAMNVYAYNNNLAAIEAEVRRINPQIVVFEEYNTTTHAGLEARLADRYPHRDIRPDWGTKGKAIFSELPLTFEAEHANADVDGRRRYVVEFAGKPLSVYVIHHRSPGGFGTVARNGGQTAHMLRQLPFEQNDAIYLGDFNASTWTPQLTALRAAGLREAFDESAWGRGGTWPGRVTRYREWLGFIIPSGLGARIDNIFLKGDLVAVTSEVGHDTHSDHRPVWADIRRRIP